MMDMEPVKNATLPEHLEDRKQIENLPLDYPAYTLPWMMQVDQDRRLWISPDAPFGPLMGTQCLGIQRTPDGFVVNTYYAHGYTWRVGDSAPKREWLPVVKIVSEPDNA